MDDVDSRRAEDTETEREDPFTGVSPWDAAAEMAQQHNNNDFSVHPSQTVEALENQIRARGAAVAVPANSGVRKTSAAKASCVIEIADSDTDQLQSSPLHKAITTARSAKAAAAKDAAAPGPKLPWAVPPKLVAAPAPKPALAKVAGAVAAPPPAPKGSISYSALSDAIAKAKSAAPAKAVGAVGSVKPTFSANQEFKYTFLEPDMFEELRTAVLDWDAFHRKYEVDSNVGLDWRKASDLVADTIIHKQDPRFMVPWKPSGGVPCKFSFQFSVVAGDQTVMGFKNVVPKSKANGEVVLVSTTERKHIAVTLSVTRKPHGDYDIDVSFVNKASGEIESHVHWTNRSGSINEAIDAAALNNRFDYSFYNSRFHDGHDKMNGHNTSKDVTCLN